MKQVFSPTVYGGALHKYVGFKVFTLRVPDIPPEGIDIPFTVAVEEVIRLSEGVLDVVRPVTGRMRVEPGVKRLLVRGFVETVIRTECARCLEAMNLEVREEVVVVFTHIAPETDKEEVESEGLDYEFYTGEEIDLWPIIQEHILLGVPIKSVCSEGCRGICPVCGVNKNQQQCQCQSPSGHPGLSGLMEIRDRLPKG